jgi:imidazolonepropionase-like amidohydrolase
MTFGELPKQNAARTEKPWSTRMGITALIRETLMKTQDYYAAKQSKKVLKDREIDMEALIPLIKGEVPMRACAYRAEDIMAAIRIAEEFKLKLVIEHGTEAHLLAATLAEKKIPVVLGPTLIPRFRNELNEKTFETLRVAAAMAIQYGLDEKRALSSITDVPAKILGVDERLGKIKKGFDADLALFSGHPLDIRSRLEALVVDGDLFTFADDLSIEHGS